MGMLGSGVSLRWASDKFVSELDLARRSPFLFLSLFCTHADVLILLQSQPTGLSSPLLLIHQPHTNVGGTRKGPVFPLIMAPLGSTSHRRNLATECSLL